MILQARERFNKLQASRESQKLTPFVSRTGSSRGYYKQNGEIIAVPHPVMKKSYASNEGQGKKPNERGIKKMPLLGCSLRTRCWPLADARRSFFRAFAAR